MRCIYGVELRTGDPSTPVKPFNLSIVRKKDANWPNGTLECGLAADVRLVSYLLIFRPLTPGGASPAPTKCAAKSARRRVGGGEWAAKNHVKEWLWVALSENGHGGAVECHALVSAALLFTCIYGCLRVFVDDTCGHWTRFRRGGRWIWGAACASTRGRGAGATGVSLLALPIR